MRVNQGGISCDPCPKGYWCDGSETVRQCLGFKSNCLGLEGCKEGFGEQRCGKCVLPFYEAAPRRPPYESESADVVEAVVTCKQCDSNSKNWTVAGSVIVLALFLMGLVFKVRCFNRWRRDYKDAKSWDYRCCCDLIDCGRTSRWWFCNIKHLSFKVLNNFSHFLWKHFFFVNLASRQFSRLSVLYSAGTLSIPQSVRDVIQTTLNGPTGSVSGCVLSAVKSWTFYDSWQTLLGITFGMCVLALVYEFFDIFYGEGEVILNGEEKDEGSKSSGGALSSFSPESTLSLGDRLADLGLRFFTNNHYSFEHSFASLTIMSIFFNAFFPYALKGTLCADGASAAANPFSRDSSNFYAPEQSCRSPFTIFSWVYVIVYSLFWLYFYLLPVFECCRCTRNFKNFSVASPELMSTIKCAADAEKLLRPTPPWLIN